MKKCLTCDAPIESFLSFGRMPLANGFLSPEDFATEFFFELNVGFCERCALVQLTNVVDREKMFHDRYPFYSSTSVRMAAHFQEWAKRVQAEYLRSDDPFVVEMGSNDGILLQPFASAGIRHLGIEPSANVAEAARAKGVRTLTRFFDAETARAVVDEHGQADVFLAANCMCHIPYLRSIAEGIRILLKPRGVLIFEDPYLGDILETVAYDQIYDEHAFYFSVEAVARIFARHGLEVVDVESQAVHGGSMRYVLARPGVFPPAPAVAGLRALEEKRGLGRLETFGRFKKDVERSRDELGALLRDLKRQGRRVVGYAATSKSTTVANYCEITPDLVEYISDTTPLKQGKYSPGVHIPVKPHAEFQARYPDYALLFAWNHAAEVLAKEREFQAAGGRWIVYVPRVAVRVG